MSEPQMTCDIIIPTFDNPSFIGPCVNSILAHTQGREAIRIIIVNNGSREIENYVTKHPLISWIHTGKNLGWEGGLKEGLKVSKSPIVCFMNDDTYVPYSSSLWALRCMSVFKDMNIGAVGPMTNVVRGYQNIFLDQVAGYHTPYASLLIGFCIFVRRSDLDAVGGIDDTLPGGDDLDLSIRLRKSGKKLAICRDVFVFHHGFKTGERVRGSPDRPGGWNSKEMTDTTNRALIRKHGLGAFLECNNGGLERPNSGIFPSRENEIEVVKTLIKPGVIYDLGCGSSKTVPEAIGIDRVPMGDVLPFMEGAKSCADLVGNVDQSLPVADESADTIISRHILEHTVDTNETLKIWISKLKPEGRLIITVPDERLAPSIPMNPEHRHAFIPDSLKTIMELLGMKQVGLRDDYNGISFTAAFEKNGAYHQKESAVA